MKYICSIIAVEDVHRSRRLYEGILHQKVTADFGEYNVSFEGGLAFYKKSLYQSLLGGGQVIASQSNNFELYFEEDDLGSVRDEILRNGFELIHPIREEPWKQNVFRFYDADRNIVVIAESMEQVSYRLFAENHSVAEISRLTGEPEEQVAQEIEKYKLLGQTPKVF